MSGRKNLVMGLFSRMTFDQLEKFLGSLRRTTFHGDVCAFVDEVTPETVATLVAHGVLIARAYPSARPELPPLSSRFFDYLEFLACHADEYEHVMLTDLRDVVFQSDPFAVPLPADIVFAQERCLIGAPTANYGWIFDSYGEAVAHNMRDCFVSCAGTTFGTTSGIMRYLVAMTRELRDRQPPFVVGLDQAVHNYIIRMRPLRHAWVDTTDSLVATMHFVRDESVRTTPQGVLIDGRLVPVVHQWDRNKATLDYVWTAPQFKLEAAQRSPRPAPTVSPGVVEPPTIERRDTIVAFYHRPRDTDWLAPFFGSLRCAGFAGGMHCVGAFDADELALLARLGCTAHPVGDAERSMDIENVAHLCISRVLDELAEDATAPPDQVLVLDTVRAGFQRDPFQARTIGLSVFCEGPTRIGESEYNLQRLAMFTALDEARLQQPIISSALLRGSLEVVRAFYRRLFQEFVGRSDVLQVQKVIQGTINKVCHDGDLGFPVIVHTHASEVYFDFWASGLNIDTAQGVRVGGAIPAVVLSGSLGSETMRAIWSGLGLAGAVT
jgi:hypothetical protein